MDTDSIAAAIGDCTPSAHEYTRVHTSTTEYNRVRRSTPEYRPSLRTSMDEYARVRRSMPENARALSAPEKIPSTPSKLLSDITQKR